MNYFLFINASHMDQTNTSTKLNASLFTDDEGESTDTAGSSDEEYRYRVRLIQQFQLLAHGGNSNTITCNRIMTQTFNVPF